MILALLDWRENYRVSLPETHIKGLICQEMPSIVRGEDWETVKAQRLMAERRKHDNGDM